MKPKLAILIPIFVLTSYGMIFADDSLDRRVADLESRVRRLEQRLASEPPKTANDVAGTYVSERKPTDYLTLNPDGTFSGQEAGHSFVGTYTRDGSMISFKTADKTTTGKLDKHSLVDQHGDPWTKKTEASTNE